MDIKVKFGLRIKELRIQKKCHKKALRFQQIEPYIQSIEKGVRNVSIMTIEKIAVVFELIKF